MIGRQIAHYRVVEKLGSGGMGEVYVAEDLRLGRRIALKVLHPELTADAERHQRFQREATTIAGLNHPHIVTLHSLEEDAGVHFITMELVEGRTLADLLPRGGFALEQLLSLGIQIADAISAAHQRGIVHRDLKPGNIMVTGDARVKVLDFGLAKLREDLAAVDFASLPTEQLTGAGRILGTTAYMSPEQAEARSVDHRSDIFSLGIILYEMATGERPFKGESHLSVISSIIKETPPTVTDVNRALPRDLGRIIRRCLAKDPTRRYQSAADLRNELEDLSQEIRASGDSVVQPAPAGTRARRRRTLFIATAVAVLATLAIIAVRQRSQRGRPSGLPQPTFMQLTAEPGIERSPSLSSDGKWLVYSSNAEGQDDIYLRSVGGDVPILLTKDSPAADTEPVFSPDSERIAFRSERDGGGIFVMGRTGESVKRITDGGFNPSWSPDASEIVYATDNVTINPFGRAAPSRLWIVTVSTGARRLLSDADGVQPSWSPHGQRMAFWSLWNEGTTADVWTIGSDGKDPVRVTNDIPTDWNPVWSPDGRYLYFASDRSGSMNLWRAPIDETSGKLLGDPESITTPAPYIADISFSADSRRIAYTSLLMTQNVQKATLDPSSGRIMGEASWLTTGSRLWSSPDPSPDGQFVAVYSRLQQEDIYVIPAKGGGLRQITNDPFIDRVPRWSPDGRRIAFFSNRSGAQNIWVVDADGSGLGQLTDSSDTMFYPVWSPDGSRMAVSSARGVYIFDPARPWRDQKPEALPPMEAGRAFVVNSWSADRRWLAGDVGVPSSGIARYSFETRGYERLTDFGEWPVWLGDNRRIMFVSGGKTLHIIDVGTKKVHDVLTVTREVLAPPRVTRDGRTVYFSRRTTEADVWLLELK